MSRLTDPPGPDSSAANTEASEVSGPSEASEKREKNNVKKLRERRLLSKAELARKSGLSALTIDRVESGMPCRMDTKRKIILALGMTVEDKDQVFEAAAEDEGS